MRVLASERARRGEGRRGVSARGVGGGGGVGARPAGRASGGFDPGTGRDAGDIRSRGRGDPNGRAGTGRRARLRASRAGRCELGEGFRVGWSSRVRFPSLGDLGAERGRRGEPRPAEARRGPCLAVAEGGGRPRSLPVPTCVQDLRDGVNAFPCSRPHPSPQSPACVATFERRFNLLGERRARGISADDQPEVFPAFSSPAPFGFKLVGFHSGLKSTVVAEDTQ